MQDTELMAQPPLHVKMTGVLAPCQIALVSFSNAPVKFKFKSLQLFSIVQKFVSSKSNITVTSIMV